MRTKHSSKTILSILAMRYAFWPLLATLSLFLLFLTLGIFVDLRWAVVAFMILCIVIPMLGAFLYIWHALKPVTALNTLPHEICETGDSFLLTIYIPPLKTDDDSSQLSETSSSDKKEKEWELKYSDQNLNQDTVNSDDPDSASDFETREITLLKSDISAKEQWGNLSLIHFGSKGILIV